jgi:hypothetical protein
MGSMLTAICQSNYMVEREIIQSNHVMAEGAPPAPLRVSGAVQNVSQINRPYRAMYPTPSSATV